MRKRDERRMIPLPEGLESHLAKYALAASAAGAVLLATSYPMQASSIVYEPLNEALSAPGVLSFSLGDTLFQFFASISNGVAFLNGGPFLISPYEFAPLPAGVEIGPNATVRYMGGIMTIFDNPYVDNPYAFRGTGSYGRAGGIFESCRFPCSGFLGLEFASHGKAHFGWADIDITQILAMSRTGKLTVFPEVTLLSIAWNRQPNASIISGQLSNNGVPEPSALSLLALGAAGLPFWRRKKARSAGD